MTNSKHIPKRRFLGFEGEWEQKQLDELSTHRSGTAIENYFSKNGLYKVISIGSYGLDGNYIDQGIRAISNDITDNQVVKKNELTMVLNDKTSNGTIIGRTLLIDSSDEFVVNQRTEIITPKNVFNPLFAFALLNGKFRDKVKKIVQGGTQIYVNYSSVKELQLHIPNLIEQQQLGILFQTIDRLITLHQHKLDKLKNLKKSYHAELFPAEGERVPKRRFPGFEGEWEEKKLGEVVEKFDNLRIPVASKDRIAGNIPYYGANGIQDYVEGFTHDGEFVLLAEDGANDLNDYPVQYVNGKVWVNNHAHVIQGKNNLIDNKFLLFAIKQIQMEPYLVGGGRAKLNAEIMMSLPLTAPEISEQRMIGAFLMKVEKQISLQQQKLNKLKDLKKAYLNELFV